MKESIELCIKFWTKLILQYIPDNCWVAGGGLRDYWSGVSKISDIDIFSNSRENLAKCVRQLRKNGAKLLYKNEKVIRLKFKSNILDIVKFCFNNPIETIDSFDFTVCCCAVTKKDLFHHEDFFIDLSRKQLKINKLPYPLSTLQRLQKYIQRGFRICNGGLLTLAKGIKEINFEDKKQNVFEWYPNGEMRFVRYD